MVFLVHHADAVDAAVDPQRPLSDAGRRHADALAARARERGAKPAVIWHSGKLRARQTAEALWRTCNPLALFAAVHGMQPADPPAWIRDAVAGDPRDIMLVGHMPHLGRLLDLMIGVPETSARAFPAHGIVALAPQQELRWVEVWEEA